MKHWLVLAGLGALTVFAVKSSVGPTPLALLFAVDILVLGWCMQSATRCVSCAAIAEYRKGPPKETTFVDEKGDR